MNNPENDKILAFDTLFTTNHIQMMKIIMPFLDASKQKHIAIYIKYMEFQYTISYFKANPFPPFPPGGDMEDMLRCVVPYCSPEQKNKMEQMQNLFSSMKNYREMMEMVSMMKEIFPEGEGGMNPDMLSGLFGTDMGAMFDMFSSMQPKDAGSSGGASGSAE